VALGLIRGATRAIVSVRMGPGIHRRELPHLFEATFYRVPA